MKKRLLSAALALAMVLTLIPATVVPAFAVDWTTGTGAPNDAGMTYTTGTGASAVTHNYYEKAANGSVTTVTVTRCNAANPTTGQEYGKWYWQKNKGNDSQAPKYMEVSTGLVAGTSGSGQWYKSIDDYTNATTSGGEKVKGAFTVLGTSGVDLSTYTDTSLNIDFANGTDSLTVPDTITSLNLTAKFTDTSSGGVAAKGQVGAITTSRGAQVTGGTNTGLNITANNINFGAISLTGRANTLTLTNCTGGGITMNGETTTTVGGANPNSWGAQTIRATGCGNLGNITITNSNGGGVTLTDSTAGTVGFTSDGGTVSVSGQSTTGMITVEARTKTGSYPTVNITGGTVAGVTQTSVANNSKAVAINVSGSSTNFGTITVNSIGNVTINSADGTAITVPEGSLKINGSGVHVTGAMTLAGTGKTTLDIAAGNSTFGSITTADGSNLTIGSWNGSRQRDGGNNYGMLTLGTYDGKKVTGGTFANGMTTTFGGVSCIPWLDTNNLQFFAVNSANTVDLYGKTELARAISDIGETQATNANGITVLAQADGKGHLVLMNGNNEWAKIGYNDWTPLYLPDRVNGMAITTWYAPSNHNIMLSTNKVENVPPPSGTPAQLVLNATGSVNTAASKITKATTSVSNTPGQVVENQNVTATLNGNNIHLTGAVSSNVGGLANILVDLETDVVDKDGNFITITGVAINYNVGTKSVSFSSIQPQQATDIGVVVINGELVLNNGTGAHYTVSANLTESASRLGIVTEGVDYQKIVVTFGGSEAGKTAAQKQVITDALAGENSNFTYGNNRAMQQAINAAQATITSNQSVESWITNTKNTIWRSGFKSPNATENTNYGYAANMAPHTGAFNSNSTDGGVINTKFSKAYIVPYLVVNVTQYDPAGTMTATLTPYYRVDVSASAGYDPDYAYTVQQGRPLSLTGVMTGNAADEIKVTFGDSLPTAFAGKFMHQDGKYVYEGAAKAWTITHVGGNGTLGTVVINDKEGLISIADTQQTGCPTMIPAADRVPPLAQLGCTYDTLQAAIDDTVRGNMVQTDPTIGVTSETMDTVVIDGQYTGSGAVTVSGQARKICVLAKGQQNVSSTSKGVTVRNVTTQVSGGYVYIIEQTQDTAPTGGNITVNSATGGSASVNANPASAGQTVTITLSASNGYTPSGVTVKDSSGKTVSVSGSGSKYTFTMPSGSVTVTPSFTLSQTVRKATVSVSPNSMGTTTTTAAATSNQVDAGSSVGVTTLPASGYRTMGVNISTNGGAATATRQGDNYFTFTVPSNATAVTVTPVYDRDNGTKFSDVWSTEYYSKSVAWAVRQGITNGTSTYGFSPSVTCTRAQMMTFLWRVAGRPTVSGVNNPFVDVYPGMGSDYYNAILWAVSKGITNGTDATHFSPSGTVTRAQAITFLYRYEGSPTVSASTGFYDVPSTEYYARAVSWAKSKGVTDGTSTYYFSPSQGVTRAQAVTFLYRDRTGDIA